MSSPTSISNSQKLLLPQKKHFKTCFSVLLDSKESKFCTKCCEEKCKLYFALALILNKTSFKSCVEENLL